MQNQPETTPVAPNNSASDQLAQSTLPQPTIAPEAPTERPRPIKPKNKKKLIAIISSCTVALALIIFGVAFAIIHNLPDKVVFDAVSGFLNAKNIELNGKFKIKSSSEYSELQSIDLDFSGATSGIANTSEVQAKMNFKDNKSYSVTLDETFTDDGVLYLKISNIKSILDQMSQSGELGLYSGIETYFGDLIGEIDGNWWKISVDDVLDGFEGMISADDKSKYSATYQCVFDKIKSAKDQNDQYAKLYGENSFVSAEKYDLADATKSGLDISNFKNSGDLYKVSFDARKMTDFLNGARNIIDADSIAACFDNVTTVETSNIEREDVEDLIDNLPEIVLSIKGWNHELKGIYLSSKTEEANSINQNEDVDCESTYEDPEDPEEKTIDCISTSSTYSEPQTDYDMYASFSYPSNLNISAPEGSKSIVDIVKKAIQTFQTILIDSFSSGVDIDINTDDTWTTDDDDTIILDGDDWGIDIDDSDDIYTDDTDVDVDDDWSDDWDTDGE